MARLQVGAASLIPRDRLAVRGAYLRIAAVALVLLVFCYGGLSFYLMNVATTATRKPLASTPAAFNLSYQDVRFESEVDHVQLVGWFLPSSSDRAIVMVHGLDGNRSAKDSLNLEVAKGYVEHGFNVLMFDLRAHGESGGDHLGLGWFEARDVRGAVDLLRQRGFAGRRIGLHGWSFGAAAALIAAADDSEIGAVMSDSSFDDSRLLFDQEQRRKTGMPPIFTPGMAVWLSAIYGLDLEAIQPIQAVPKIAPRPILFVHGEADTRIPRSHSVRLQQASGAGNELWLVPGAEHTKGYEVRPGEYLARVVAFFNRGLN